MFDGHGSYGDASALFCREVLPQRLAAKLAHDGQNAEAALKAAFLQTNKELHRQGGIDTDLSGTTCVLTLIIGTTMYTANVADSRAILATGRGESIGAVALSNDQTPYRKDERERVIGRGAQVYSKAERDGEIASVNWSSIDIKEGCVHVGGAGRAVHPPSTAGPRPSTRPCPERAPTSDPNPHRQPRPPTPTANPCRYMDPDSADDPPRVWNKDSPPLPGLPCTRSLGDLCGEVVGVCAEPEVLVRKIDPSVDQFIVVASDGVWEFLRNKTVCDTVRKAGGDPLVAAKNLADDSYQVWMELDERSDDITVICCFLRSRSEGAGKGSGRGGTMEIDSGI